MADPFDYQIIAEGSDLWAFYELYRHTVRALANWSETTVLSTQEYLHLHEKDIGGGLQEYKMWGYLKAFVESLGPDLREKLKRVVFCFSFEDFLQPSVSIEACLRQDFYWYALNEPSKQELVGMDFKRTGSNALTRPDPSKITDHLPETLKDCSWLQLYMLQGNPRVEVLQAVLPATPAVLNAAMTRHARHGSYQFSIYGYELKEGAILSPQEVLLLNMAFLIHVWTWNHDLRAAHGLRRLVHDQLRTVDIEVRKALENIRAVGHSLQGLQRVLIASEPDLHERNREGSMFQVPHTLMDWTVKDTETYFRRFTKIVAGQQQKFRRLARFVELCGWQLPVDRVAVGDRERARATWMATRCLTRRALGRESARLVSPDQIALAVLLGLDWEDADYLPVRVAKTLEGFKPRDSDDKLMEALWLVKARRRDLDWTSTHRKVARDNAKASFQVSWKSVQQEPEVGVLRQFMDSGMLSFATDDATLEVLKIPKPRDTSSEFLKPLYDLALALSSQRRRLDEKLAHLSEVVIETTRSGNRHQTQVRFQMDALLPGRVGMPGSGEINQPLGELGLFFGSERAIHLEGRSLDAGVYIPAESGRSSIVIMLQGRDDEETLR